MLRHKIASRSFIVLLLILQFVPLVLFPPESFSPKTQEWWLPVMLAVLALVGTVQLVGRGSGEAWPWYLMSFAQGFNVISRIMLIWPHATVQVSSVNVPNWPYIILSFVSMALSTFMLWYMELPEVRMGLVRE